MRSMTGMMRPLCALFATAVYMVMVANAKPVDNHYAPVIGILTTPMDRDESKPGSAGCFGAYYVQWLEQSGLRVARVDYDSSEDEINEAVASLNGFLFTGGDLPLTTNTTYYKTANTLYQKIKQKNDSGVHLPLWATCMGFQLIHLLEANDQSVLSRNVMQGVDGASLALELTPYAEARSKILSSPSLRHDLSHYPITDNLHNDAILVESFNSNDRLQAVFAVLSTNVDTKKTEFVSMVEAKHYPIYGTQWHPERPQFVFNDHNQANHSSVAIRSMQHMSYLYAQEVQLNDQRISSTSTMNRNIITTQLRSQGEPGVVYYAFGEKLDWYPACST